MKVWIIDISSINFANAFYEIATGRDYEFSFNFANAFLRTNNYVVIEIESPILINKDEVKDENDLVSGLHEKE